MLTNAPTISTYRLLIPQSVCSQLKIKVGPNELKAAMQDESSFYHVVCQAPIQLMINGIILAQIKTYQIFLQKRLIDCYVNTAPTVNEVEITGEDPPINESINEMKEQFLQHAESFKPLEQSHFNLIADTYGYLKKFISAHQNQQAQTKAFDADFKSKIDAFVAEGKILEAQLIQERLKWREHAIEISDTMMKMGSGRIDDIQELEQRAELAFLQSFGESK